MLRRRTSPNSDRLPQKSNVGEAVAKYCFLFAAFFSIIAVIAIVLFLLMRGVPAIHKIGFIDFIFGRTWNPVNADRFEGEIAGSYGIFPMIVGSLYSVAGALLVGGTLGFFSAAYIAFFCPKRVKTLLKQFINLLAGIPSIIYGFFGIMVINRFLGGFTINGDGAGILSVSIVLGIMILPTITAITVAGFESVDKSYYEGALALGATKNQAVFKVLVPAAKSSILASLILGIGRAIGETMAVVMIAGNAPSIPTGLIESFRTLTANIVMEMAYADTTGLTMGALIGTGVVLLAFVALINLAFGIVFNNKKSAKPKTQRAAKGSKTFGKVKKVLLFVVLPIKLLLSWTKEKISFRKKTSLCLAVCSYACTCITIFMLVFIVGFVVLRGAPHINSSLFSSTFSYSGAPTILPSIVATLLMVIVSSVIAFPIGIAAAIYLREYTSNTSKIVRAIRVAVDIMGGIPSIVYGLFGMILFVQIFNLGTSILAGSLTVSLITKPITVRSVEEALKSVPNSYREGSYALGAGKLRTIYKVVLPSALPGILAAVILGIGKMTAESAPFMFTMGASRKPMPKGLSSGGTTLTVAFYTLIREGIHPNEAYATGCVLIIVVLLLNIFSSALVLKLQSKLLGKKQSTKKKKQYAK